MGRMGNEACDFQPATLQLDTSRLHYRLRSERTRVGLSQAALAARIGVSTLTQLNYEMGRRRPGVEYLARLSALGIDSVYVSFGIRIDLGEASLSSVDPD